MHVAASSSNSASQSPQAQLYTNAYASQFGRAASGGLLNRDAEPKLDANACPLLNGGAGVVLADEDRDSTSSQLAPAPGSGGSLTQSPNVEPSTGSPFRSDTEYTSNLDCFDQCSRDSAGTQNGAEEPFPPTALAMSTTSTQFRRLQRLATQNPSVLRKYGITSVHLENGPSIGHINVVKEKEPVESTTKRNYVAVPRSMKFPVIVPKPESKNAQKRSHVDSPRRSDSQNAIKCKWAVKRKYRYTVENPEQGMASTESPMLVNLLSKSVSSSSENSQTPPHSIAMPRFQPSMPPNAMGRPYNPQMAMNGGIVMVNGSGGQVMHVDDRPTSDGHHHPHMPPVAGKPKIPYNPQEAEPAEQPPAAKKPRKSRAKKQPKEEPKKAEPGPQMPQMNQCPPPQPSMQEYYLVQQQQHQGMQQARVPPVGMHAVPPHMQQYRIPYQQYPGQQPMPGMPPRQPYGQPGPYPPQMWQAMPGMSEEQQLQVQQQQQQMRMHPQMQQQMYGYPRPHPGQVPGEEGGMHPQQQMPNGHPMTPGEMEFRRRQQMRMQQINAHQAQLRQMEVAQFQGQQQQQQPQRPQQEQARQMMEFGDGMEDLAASIRGDADEFDLDSIEPMRTENSTEKHAKPSTSSGPAPKQRKRTKADLKRANDAEQAELLRAMIKDPDEPQSPSTANAADKERINSVVDCAIERGMREHTPPAAPAPKRRGRAAAQQQHQQQVPQARQPPPSFHGHHLVQQPTTSGASPAFPHHHSAEMSAVLQQRQQQQQPHPQQQQQQLHNAPPHYQQHASHAPQLPQDIVPHVYASPAQTPHHSHAQDNFLYSDATTALQSASGTSGAAEPRSAASSATTASAPTPSSNHRASIDDVSTSSSVHDDFFESQKFCVFRSGETEDKRNNSSFVFTENHTESTLNYHQHVNMPPEAGAYHRPSNWDFVEQKPTQPEKRIPAKEELHDIRVEQ